MDLSNISQNSDPHNVQLLLSLLQNPEESSGSSVTAQAKAPSPPQPVAHHAQSIDPRKRPASHVSPPPLSSKPSKEEADGAAFNAQNGSGKATGSGNPAPDATQPAAKQQQRPDVSRLSAAQALPYLRRLASSAPFLRALMTLKKEQDHLERLLAREYEEMQDGKETVGQDELEKWQARALTRWDLMLKRQQTRLQELHTPGFYPTTSRSARANQSQILDLISGLIDDV